MFIHEIELPKELDCIYIIPISDLHIGDPNLDDTKLFKYLEWIKKTPNAYIILNGDIMNTAIKNSVSDVYSETMNPKEQLRFAKKVFEPYKDRILSVVQGNHERRIEKDTGINTSEILANYLNPEGSKKMCYFAGDEAYLKIKLGHYPRSGVKKPIIYTIYHTHGWGAGRTAGAKVNNLQKLSDIVLADIYIASHTHFMTAHQDVYKIPDIRTNKFTEIKRTYVSSGAFLKRGGYAAQKGYPHAKLGSPRLRLDGRTKDVHVSI